MTRYKMPITSVCFQFNLWLVKAGQNAGFDKRFIMSISGAPIMQVLRLPLG